MEYCWPVFGAAQWKNDRFAARYCSTTPRRKSGPALRYYWPSAIYIHITLRVFRRLLFEIQIVLIFRYGGTLENHAHTLLEMRETDHFLHSAKYKCTPPSFYNSQMGSHIPNGIFGSWCLCDATLFLRSRAGFFLSEGDESCF